MAMTPEVKASRAILAALDVMDFNSGILAYLLNKAPASVQNRLLEVFVHLIKQWCIEYDSSKGFRDDELDRLVMARRLLDTLEQYGYGEYKSKH